MKITKRQLEKVIHRLREERESLKDILDHQRPEDVGHATHLSWEGGDTGDEEQDNLVMPLDHTCLTTGDDTLSILDDASMQIVGESYGESHASLDPDGDTYLTPEELYAHFDLDGDGIVSVADYVAHVRWHCENPSAFDKEGMGDSIPDDVMHFVLDNLGLTLSLDAPE